MSVPVTALGLASFKHLEIDTALRQTFDWWCETELRDMDPNNDMEKFVAMFWSVMRAHYLNEEAEA